MGVTVYLISFSKIFSYCHHVKCSFRFNSGRFQVSIILMLQQHYREALKERQKTRKSNEMVIHF